MKAPTSEYRREAARLRALIAEATTARARQHLEEQVRLNERLATGRPQAARRDVLDFSLRPRRAIPQDEGRGWLDCPSRADAFRIPVPRRPGPRLLDS